MKNLLYIGNKLQKANKTASTIDTLSKKLTVEGFHVISASSLNNKLLRLLDMLWHIVINRKKTDLVLIDTYSTLNFYYAYLSSKLCVAFKLNYMPILHGGNLPVRIKNTPKLSNALFKKAYLNVAPSMYLMESFKEFGFNNLMYIPNSIEIENYTFQKRELDKVKLLWVRSFSKIYNPELAVKIVKALKDENIEAELCMVGPDNDGSMIQTKDLASKLNVDVKFTGKLSKVEWINLAENYNVFINTTNVDNMPVSVIEAMALGLTVISTNVGGVPFLIKEGVDGLLVPPNDVNGFVKAIISLLKSDKKVSDLTIQARKKVEKFDWEVVKEKWLKILS